MNRRGALLASAAFFLAATQLYAQRAARIARIGLVMGQENEDARRFLAAFREGMKEHGYEEGRNLVLAARHYGRNRSALPGLVDELIAWEADVLVANVSSTAAVLKNRTKTIPIVMVTAVDAVAEGLVASLARPGGNVTGMTSPGSVMHAKLVELTRDLLPRAQRIALVVNPGHSLSASYEAAAVQAAKRLGLEAVTLRVTGVSDMGRLGEQLAASRADAMVVATDAVLFGLRDALVQASAKARLPTVALLPEFAASGAVASLGFDMVGNYRAAARYVDRILKGAKPADLPVEQPTHFELVLNLGSARALGLPVPQPVLVRVDRVVDR